MAKAFWSGDRSRKIVKRIIVEGDLVLQTPAHFGSGDADDLVDMPLLTDPYKGKPLLTGASIAGALRSYLREQEQGYGRQARKADASVRLFGGLKGDDTGEQSCLIVEDAIGDAPGTVIRHGVRLKGDSRTAADKALYDTQFWQAGTKFLLRFELLIREEDDEAKLKSALATALTGLENGRITLGARKRRGYGEVKVNGWQAKTFVLTHPNGLLDWLQHGGDPLPPSLKPTTIQKALGNAALLDSQLKSFAIQAEFGLDGSLLIRSGEGRDDAGPDMGERVGDRKRPCRPRPEPGQH
jgi:CRISPR/Cas system CSM-associated protein Csm3 (group 7 of RAMP superfamily)